MTTARHRREAPGHQASGTFSPWARGPRWPRFLSSVWSLQFFHAFPGADPVPPLVYASFHRSLNTGHWGEQPVSTCRTSGLSACYPGRSPAPPGFCVLSWQRADDPRGCPARCLCSRAGTWWFWLPWGLLGRLGGSSTRGPQTPLCTLPWPPGQLRGSHSAVSVKSVWLKSRVFSGE